ncbi:hypothetical protein LINGRAHAP2_LOCUS34091 [Linum grandiflorum]
MEGGGLGDGTKLPDDPAELLISDERLAMFEKELEDSAASRGVVLMKPSRRVMRNMLIGFNGPHFWYASKSSTEGEKFDEFGRKLVRGGFTEDDDISAEEKTIRLAKLRELAEEYKANGRKFVAKPDASKSWTEGGGSGAGKKLVSAEEKAIVYAKFNKAVDDYYTDKVNPPDEYKAAYKTYMEMGRAELEARRKERLARRMEKDMTVSKMEKIKMFTKDLEEAPGSYLAISLLLIMIMIVTDGALLYWFAVQVPVNPDTKKWGLASRRVVLSDEENAIIQMFADDTRRNFEARRSDVEFISLI